MCFIRWRYIGVAHWKHNHENLTYIKTIGLFHVPFLLHPYYFPYICHWDKKPIRHRSIWSKLHLELKNLNMFYHNTHLIVIVFHHIVLPNKIISMVALETLVGLQSVVFIPHLSSKLIFWKLKYLYITNSSDLTELRLNSWLKIIDRYIILWFYFEAKDFKENVFPCIDKSNCIRKSPGDRQLQICIAFIHDKESICWNS